ncbi:MAG: ribose-phosphate pyrophosphokinase, partial [Gammaproteobacteria bacterium]|nr:ribose-phosphate pyrophosphokinase [Gammaproteobacteria bacterium]
LAAAGFRGGGAAPTTGERVGNAIDNLRDSPIEALTVTNTVDVAPEKRLDKMTVLSVAPLMAEAIRRIHTGESVGALFA